MAIQGSRHSSPTLRLRQSTRAIRAALLAGAALAAFGSAGTAFAGSCVVSAGTISCDGVFETPTPDAPLGFTGDDLTVVFGAEAPSSVVATGVDGIAILAPGGTATVINYGEVEAIGGGNAQAIDIAAYGDVVFGNYGSATATMAAGSGAPYDVTAVSLYSYAGSVFASNAAGASILASVEADYGYTLARGVYSVGDNAYLDNAGDIEVSGAVELGNVVAIGVQQVGQGFSNLYNEADASIIVSAESGQGVTYGADAFSVGAFITGTSAYVYNAGAISAESTLHNGEGIATAIGAEVYEFYGFATTTNTGTISAHAIVDSPDASYSFAYGVINKGFYLQGVASVNNYGTISAEADTYFGAAIAYGARNFALYSATNNAEGATIQAIAQVDYAGMASAVGVDTYGKYYAHDVNAGTISAYASSAYTEHYGRFTYASAGATALIEDARYFGGAVLENSGVITATALTRDVAGFFGGLTGATGVHQYGKYYAGIDNSGEISAYASANLGLSVAYGVIQKSKYGSYTVVENSEGASIVAVAHSGSTADDYSGGAAFADAVRMFGGSFALLYNDGLLAAEASLDANDRTYLDDSGHAMAYGAYMVGHYGATLHNGGTIQAMAEADYAHASAYGVAMHGDYYAVGYNEGGIVAIASADHGEALAVGLYIDSPGQAFYQGCGQNGCYYTYYGGMSALENDGAIHAHASADDGLAEAYGAVVRGRLHAQATNRGQIQAVAESDGGSALAVGLLLQSSYGDAWLDNAEGASIVASTYGTDASATGVLFATYGHAEVYNAGTIAALGDGERIAIDARLSSDAAIYNYGLVAGSILTGAGDDLLVNEAGGRIRLADAGIDLGYHYAYGNHFYNYGTVSVDGASSIDMGSGPATLVPSLNPYAFYNYGVIDFQDGAADDSLLVVGDFAGEGEINVDVSGLDGTSDQLYIDGSVVAGTVQTINVDLLDVPGVGASLVPIVYVSGDSVAGDFVLGDVNWDDINTFVTLDFDIVSDIDTSNATPDVFSLGIQVTGLSDPGTLAASIPGAMQSLANSSVGTWRQRMGVIDNFNKGAISLWARVWQDNGAFSPDHIAANFGQGGNFDWRQKNSGIEAGIDFAVTDEFSIGLLLGQSKADTHLDGASASHSNIDADTWGIYGTWISPTGFYLDASYRWMSFDVDLSSVAGPMSFSDNAETFNIELGYAWTLASGLKIEPQFQYTRTNLDDFDPLVTSTGMSFVNEGGESSRGRLGVAFRKSFGEADAGWLWTPYVTISAVREFDGENLYSINNVFHGETDIGGTSTLLELGFTARHQNWSIYGGLNWQDGGAVNSFFGGQLGVRYTFGGPAPVVAAPTPPPPPAKTCAELDDDGDGVNNCDDKCPAQMGVAPDGCPVPAAPEPEPVPAPKPFRG